MPEMFTTEKRSQIMGRIKSKNTLIENTVRKIIYSLGYRYRLHAKDLPGKPDVIIRRLRKAIIINGCFWHGHENCALHVKPKSNIQYWKPKIEGNILRDQKNLPKLIDVDWKAVIIWECTLRGKGKIPLANLRTDIGDAIRSDQKIIELAGKKVFV